LNSLADYERIHTEVLSRLPGVSRIQSSFTIRNVIAQPQLRALITASFSSGRRISD
jgi:DNA-binding Lrp family transcriptional regulator